MFFVTSGAIRDCRCKIHTGYNQYYRGRRPQSEENTNSVHDCRCEMHTEYIHYYKRVVHRLMGNTKSAGMHTEYNHRVASSNRTKICSALKDSSRTNMFYFYIAFRHHVAPQHDGGPYPAAAVVLDCDPVAKRRWKRNKCSWVYSPPNR